LLFFGYSIVCLHPKLLAQQSYTWEQIKDKFQAVNPVLRAGAIGIDEYRAQEVTAYLRPNPQLNIWADQFEPFSRNPSQPLTNALTTSTLSYLHERQHKRELRLESAAKATGIAESQQEDLTRVLLFNLRSAFVQTLQAKAVRDLARQNLDQYDQLLALNRERLKAGDIAQVDMDRLALARVQFESDLRAAEVNLRTAKIQLLSLLNDRTSVDNFDVTGKFDFNDRVLPLDEFRRMALENRPDLRASIQAVDKAQTDHRLAVANGSTDPTFSFDYGRNGQPPPLTNYMGFSVSIPLRIFDRNQGEKARTELDIARMEQLRAASEAQIFSDVDSAYATLNNTVALLRSYRATYLGTATKVRDTINYSFQHGASSLLDFLQAQQDYRAVQVTYLNLIGSYLTAAGQLNLAVGREAIQ
jgi:cobalt-zinc-cadmium efflux system outer membrane protein